MQLLSGNEAIARGAWEAGATIGVAYPGTPSTETMEAFGKYTDVYAEWCPNEKVAVEVGIGASVAGRRVLSSMKHVGVNVAADPLYTAAYTGVNGGFVILAADDPGMHSSQNEQDSRHHALGARIPILDPANSQEALDYTKLAFELSERFDIPFFIRSTVRVSHTKCPVKVGERIEVSQKPYTKDAAKWVMMPAYAKPRRRSLDERIAALTEYLETSELNRMELNDTRTGIICTGATYQHVKEALPDASILKLGASWPLSANLLHSFADKCEEVFVIEEASDYLSRQVASMGIKLSQTPEPLPCYGELSPLLIRQGFGLESPACRETPENLPPRPPALCAGCPHRMVFRELSRMRAIVTGDIGCYTLGALAPLNAMDTCIDMGASISMAHGFELGLQGASHRPVVAVIGDSTFAHSGITSLLNTIYNQGIGTVCILDNRTTAMTGRQGNPCNGVTLQNRPSRELDLPLLVKALGVEDVQVVNPQQGEDVRRALQAATKFDGLSVIIFESPCILLERKKAQPYYIDQDTCKFCGACMLLGCPALSRDKGKRLIEIDPNQCIGCGQCEQACMFGSIIQKEEQHV